MLLLHSRIIPQNSSFSITTFYVILLAQQLISYTTINYRIFFLGQSYFKSYQFLEFPLI